MTGMEPAVWLCAFALLNAFAALLLLLAGRLLPVRRGRERRDAAAVSAAHDGVESSTQAVEAVSSTEEPLFRGEERLIENLERWRARHAGGEILPVSADACRSNRRVAEGYLA
jgi:hypothetical protein